MGKSDDVAPILLRFLRVAVNVIGNPSALFDSCLKMPDKLLLIAR
jgi:hypothetical protein